MNDNSEIVYDEKEDKCLFYYQDKAIDITKMFDKEKECYLVINNGEKDIYFVISYEDKIDDDCTISQYSDENATVTQGVKVKDIKNRFEVNRKSWTNLGGSLHFPPFFDTIN